MDIKGQSQVLTTTDRIRKIDQGLGRYLYSDTVYTAL